MRSTAERGLKNAFRPRDFEPIYNLGTTPPLQNGPSAANTDGKRKLPKINTGELRTQWPRRTHFTFYTRLVIAANRENAFDIVWTRLWLGTKYTSHLAHPSEWRWRMNQWIYIFKSICSTYTFLYSIYMLSLILVLNLVKFSVKNTYYRVKR